MEFLNPAVEYLSQITHTNKQGFFHLCCVFTVFYMALIMSCASLRAPVGLDNIFDCPSADGAARVGHLLEFEPAGVAETHVATGVEDRVHDVLVANGAFVAPRARAGWKGRRLGMAGEWRAWGCTLGDKRKKTLERWNMKEKLETKTKPKC